MEVVVIGGGPVGLAVAHGLVASGHDVVVLEAGGQARPQGSGLSIFGNGLAALGSLGLGTAMHHLTGAVAPTAGGVRTPGGRWLVRTPDTALWNMRVVHREALHQMLLSALPSGTVRFESPAELASTEDGVVTVDGDSQLRADLVVVADGIRSGSRRQVSSDPGYHGVGYGAWRGVTRGEMRGIPPSETWGAGLRFGLVPLTDGRAYWFAVKNGDDLADDRDHLARVLDLFAGWHEPIADVIRATDPEVVSWLPIEELVRPLESLARGRAVLVGDAAHAMTPNLGQGANQGFEDAATLCVLLHTEPDLPRALDRYDRLRRPRTRRVARDSRLIGTVAQLSRPALVRTRDLVLFATPDVVSGRQFRQFDTWRPPR
ncbi:MAG: FAD-dependent monooxygenase [Intrasporangium sp.]|uniref:FAD-dependent monooxygenase n=1 Tax=Intrasporangium sp. TaxID=1925024 RepID=UPI0026477317|nr:FAD-dependent monooxygenase [Intrasporangium sp.]MDN5797055.1 FAD-dependent monooxygenase [Intrasporangium sp.]